MAKPDPFLSLLKDIGFLPLRLPRADVAPLDMVEEDGKDLNLLGAMTNAMVPAAGVTAPPIVHDIQTAQNIQGTKTSQVKLGIGVTILGNILKAITGQNLAISAAFQNASTMTFQFADSSVDKVDIILLDRFLSQSDIDPHLTQIHNLLIEGKMAIITAVTKTKKYLVTAQRDNGAQVSIDVPVLQQVAGGSLKIDAASSDNTKVSFEGPTPLAFGVQAIRVSFDENGKFTAFDPMKAGEGAVRGLPLAAVSQPNIIHPQALFVDVKTAARTAGM